MKPVGALLIEEEQRDEETDWPEIPLVSSACSHTSSVQSARKETIETARPSGGRPPLPRHLQMEEQARDDCPAKPILGRDQSTDTAVSGLTDNSPADSPTHNRKISWDANVLDTGIAVDRFPSPQSQPKKNRSPPSNKVLSVGDLHATSPLEAEAETSILKSIEEREDDPAAIGRNILAGVPASAAESYREGKTTSQRSSQFSRTRAKPTTTRKKADLEETLLDLTVAMRDLNNDMAVIPEHEEDHCTSLLNDANILFRRSLKKEKSVRHLTSSSSDNTDDVDPELGESDVLSDESGVDDDKNDKQQRWCGPFKCCKKRTICGKSIEEDLATFSDFIRPRRATIMLHLKTILFGFILPVLTIAALLFYALGNPGLGKHGASWSWMLLFLIRHSILYIAARFTMIFCIDFLALNKMCTVRVLGPFPSLCLVQSRGFPFVMSAHAFYALLALTGKNNFAKHWLFYQDAISMCNEANPAGTITESTMNYAILCCAIALGTAVTLKRVLSGLHFGRRTYRLFGEDVAKVVRKILLIAEVAALAKDLEFGTHIEQIQMRAATLAFNIEAYDDQKHTFSEDGSEADVSSGMSYSDIIDHARRDRYTESLTDSQRNQIMGLLESWEEPETEKKAKTGDVSISAILQFRQALTVTFNDYPFSMAFGIADTREHCIESSQVVYKRLLQRQGDDTAVLDFDTIALLATTYDGDIERVKMKDLIHLFRPERDGTLTMVDFVKSVDAVYKRLRLLSASIENTSQIDQVAERILNCIFYTIATILIVDVLGYDPLALFLSLSSILVAFAFMIGNASSKYFEGIIFVLARKPYNIGDRIHVSKVDEDTNPNGSSSWYVENVNLFTTTIRFATTNEVATVSNGSLASSRIINAARSPKMLVYVYMKFGVDVPYQKVKLFRKTVEEFVKQRPRDWLSMRGFRATRVEQELGFIEYVMVLQHRERWQNVIPMLSAKAELSSFALEVAKKLNMPYRAPSLPVDLKMGNATMNRLKEEVFTEGNPEEMSRYGSNRTAPDMSDLAKMFGGTGSVTGSWGD